MGSLVRTIGVVTLVACGFAAQANESEGPIYQRHRGGAGYEGQTAYGQYPWHYPGYPYYGSWYYPQTSYGNWFTRPYPTHLDYFGLRRQAPPLTPDCPCASVQAVE